ncbi:hypothetical protein [Pseudorhodobacter sp.]|nr:hypothetical protein [Pseudorhodobacter sp.]MDN5787656.1 hypothetical protein [Pseudorhodobacter sp.]
MRFPRLISQAEIDVQLRRAKPRATCLPGLPSGAALIGLALYFTLQALL